MTVEPKKPIRDFDTYVKDKLIHGNLVSEVMSTTGGTDVDWLIEHDWGFMLFETKVFRGNKISLQWGQMTAFVRLYTRLKANSNCVFFIVGFEGDVDFKNDDMHIHYFTMDEWLGKEGKKVPYTYDKKFKKFEVNRYSMHPIKMKEFRELIDQTWKKFQEKGNSSYKSW